MVTSEDIRRKARLALITRAASPLPAQVDREQLRRYWTEDPRALRKWWLRPSGRFTALRRHLLKFMDPGRATRTAAEWFHLKAGYWPGSDLNRIHAGKPPRGSKVGPG